MEFYQLIGLKEGQNVVRFSVKSALVFLFLAGLLIPAKSMHAQQKRIFLPMISTVVLEDLAPAGGNRLDPCPRLSAEEMAMGRQFLNDSGQQRPTMNCNPTLAAVARARAQDMANRNYFSHINPDGVGPDTLIERAGYNLPDWYGVTIDSNHVESIAAGTSYPTAQAAWTALMGSPSHVPHLRGQTSFYVEQTEFGIGYAYSSNARYRSYWVIITAHPSE